MVKTSSKDARIVVTSSSMHSFCRHLDLDLLTSPARPKYRLYDSIWRYGRSKLGDILLTKELARRLQQGDDPADRNIYVNCFFPGNIVTEQWNGWDDIFGKPIGVMMRAVFSMLGQSREDAAATAIFLAASREVREEDRRGQYLIPIAKPYTPTSIACDEKLARDLWVSRFVLHGWPSCSQDSFIPGLDRCQSNRDTWVQLARGCRWFSQNLIRTCIYSRA